MDRGREREKERIRLSAESAFIAPTSRLLMVRSKTGRNNPTDPPADVDRGFREGNKGLRQEPSEVGDNTLRFGALSLSLSLPRLRDCRDLELARCYTRRDAGDACSLFKLDTWPRLRGSRGSAQAVFVCMRSLVFENQNQIHYSGLDRRPRESSYCRPLSAWKRSRDFIGRLTIASARYATNAFLIKRLGKT